MTKASNQTKRAIALRDALLVRCADIVNDQTDRGLQGTWSHNYASTLRNLTGILAGNEGPIRREAGWQALMDDTGLNPSVDENGEIAKVQPSQDTRDITLGLLGSEYDRLTRPSVEDILNKL